MNEGSHARQDLHPDEEGHSRKTLGESGPIRWSVASLLDHQSENGAFVASPDFAQYDFCWLRDASFIAYALDLAGEHDAASRYHGWVDRTIGSQGIGPAIEAAIEKHCAGEPLVPGDMPPARFSLTGERVADDWPNFQIDGYGTWLWSLNEHLRLSEAESLTPALQTTVERTARYLSTFAFAPCFDVWEENGGEIHSSTLASVIGGLTAASALLADPRFDDRAAEVRSYLEHHTPKAGQIVKSNARSEVDASALWLGAPFNVFAADDPRLLATVAEIEDKLVDDNGGVRRYAADTYFGGGSWPVLTCSLGWHYSRAGRLDDADHCLDWTRAHIDGEGRLGEQFGGEGRDREHYDEWVQRWGHPARDLLWSHAMHVVLSTHIAATRSGARSNEFELHINERSWTDGEE